NHVALGRQRVTVRSPGTEVPPSSLVTQPEAIAARRKHRAALAADYELVWPLKVSADGARTQAVNDCGIRLIHQRGPRPSEPAQPFRRAAASSAYQFGSTMGHALRSTGLQRADDESTVASVLLQTLQEQVGPLQQFLLPVEIGEGPPDHFFLPIE